MGDYKIYLAATRCADEVDRASGGKSDGAYDELVASISDAIRSFLASPAAEDTPA